MRHNLDPEVGSEEIHDGNSWDDYLESPGEKGGTSLFLTHLLSSWTLATLGLVVNKQI